MMNSKSAAPSKIDRKRALLKSLSAGSNLTEAAEKVGITRNTARAWRDAAELDKEDGIPAVLKSILNDPDQSGSYRVAAAKALMEAARGPDGRQEMPKSVLTWLDGLDARLGLITSKHACPDCRCGATDQPQHATTQSLTPASDKG